MTVMPLNIPAFRDLDQPPVDGLVGRFPGDVLAHEFDGARGGPDQARNGSQGGGFAGTVGPEQGDDSPPCPLRLMPRRAWILP